jgi:hypothetical protein
MLIFHRLHALGVSDVVLCTKNWYMILIDSYLHILSYIELFKKGAVLLLHTLFFLDLKKRAVLLLHRFHIFSCRIYTGLFITS